MIRPIPFYETGALSTPRMKSLVYESGQMLLPLNVSSTCIRTMELRHTIYHLMQLLSKLLITLPSQSILFTSKVGEKAFSMLRMNPVLLVIRTLRNSSNTTEAQNFSKLEHGTEREPSASLRLRFKILILSIMLDWTYLKMVMKNWTKKKGM